MAKIIQLSTKEQLNIYMSPQRQQLLRVMSVYGAPITAKGLADKLGISASSATHHISKLKRLGVVEDDHTEMINGIVAKFFRLSDVSVSIGCDIGDSLSGERGAVVQSIIQNTLSGFNRGIEEARNRGIPQSRLKDYGDCLTGVLHLQPEDARELMELIRKYIDEHETFSQGTQPWEYALILYNSEHTR